MANNGRSAKAIKSFFLSDTRYGKTASISWSRDGKKLAWLTTPIEPGEERNYTVDIWDREKALHQIVELDGEVSIAFEPQDQILWIAGEDGRFNTLDLVSNDLHAIQECRLEGPVNSIAWSPDGKFLAAANRHGDIRVWDKNLRLVYDGIIHRQKDEKGIKSRDISLGISWAPDSRHIASAGYNATVINIATGSQHRLVSRAGLYQVVWMPDMKTPWLAGAAANGSIVLWNGITGEEYRVLPGHNSHVTSIDFSKDGTLFASQDRNGKTIIWRCSDWTQVRTIRGQGRSALRHGLSFHPQLNWLAGSRLEHNSKVDVRLQLHELNFPLLLNATSSSTVTYKSAKIVLVGESGAGKTGLGWRLAHSKFKEHASTHGQQFWLLEQLKYTSPDGAQCEAVLWDLAGQPDYRLIHGLFLDDVDLALIVFDPTKTEDPLYGVEFWVKQLQARNLQSASVPPPIILVAARADRGSTRLTAQELTQFCNSRGLSNYICTSALTGDGIPDLIEAMAKSIAWNKKIATVTTDTFKEIKDYVLRLKEMQTEASVIIALEDLRRLLKTENSKSAFSSADLLTVVRHLANHGYVAILKTSKGEPRILLVPELLNNLAASIILEARRNPRGLGSLEEKPLLEGRYRFAELEHLSATEQVTLLDSTITMLLRNNVCYRETDRFNSRSYLVFPELINMKKPSTEDEISINDGAAYTVIGAVENTYASLVVLLGYTDRFTRTHQWRDQARYEVGDGLICGFRLEDEREGELDFVLYFGENVEETVRTLFTSLFENFLVNGKLEVRRFDPLKCHKGHLINRSIVREQLSANQQHAFCPRCGTRVLLPRNNQAIRLTGEEAKAVATEGRAAIQRSLLEQAMFRLASYARQKGVTTPTCFISYAWGTPEHERWAARFASDLQKAGIPVVFDRWENNQIGSSVSRFVEQVSKSDRVIVIGTPAYREKYENRDPMRGFVVAAEGDLIGARLIGTEDKKKEVLPILLDGEDIESFPNILLGRVYGDFRDNTLYAESFINLLLTLFNVGGRERIATELMGTLHDNGSKFD